MKKLINNFFYSLSYTHNHFLEILSGEYIFPEFFSVPSYNYEYYSKYIDIEKESGGIYSKNNKFNFRKNIYSGKIQVDTGYFGWMNVIDDNIKPTVEL